MRNALERSKRRDQLLKLRLFLADPVGREYFYDLLASCHVYSTSFGTNALMMAFNEGERNVGLRLGADLTEAAPDLYLQMLKEGGNVREPPTATEREPEPGTGFSDTAGA